MKTVLQNLPDCFQTSNHYYFVVLDLEGRFVFCNPFFQKKFQHLSSSINGFSFFMESHSPDASIVRKKFEEFLNRKSEVKIIEQRLADEKGGYFWIRWEMNLMAGEDGQADVIQCIGIDITESKKNEYEIQRMADRYDAERKLAERSIATSEHFYRNLIANSLDGMLILNEEGIIRFVSPSVENILGFTSEDLLDKNGFTYIHPDDHALSIESFNRELIEQPVIKSIVVRLLNKNGSWTWCMLRGHNLVNNPFVKGIVIYFYDDTLRKQAREILKESESRFRNLIADLQIGVMLLNNQKEITLCNKAGLQILGYNDKASLVGKTTSDLDWDIIDENHKPLPARLRPSFMAFHTRRSIKDVVMGVKKHNHHSRSWVLVNAVPIQDDAGEIIHVITSFSDITERRILENKLRADELNKQKLLTQATIDGQEKERKEIGKELHDNVGQQLTTTKLFLEIAKSTAEDNALEMINMAIKSISDSINEVRSISRSLVPPTLGDLGLVDSVKELCHSLKRTQAFQIRFYHNGFDENNLPANQALMLYRIIQEQVNNIIKHSEARAVILQLRTENENTVLEIVDNGKGFDPGNHKKGLGLINMTNRAELFNGKLEITAGINKGCRIRVAIPFNQP